MGSFSEITNPSSVQAKIDIPVDNPLHSSIITSDCNEGVQIDHREVGEEVNFVSCPLVFYQQNMLYGYSVCYYDALGNSG